MSRSLRPPYLRCQRDPLPLILTMVVEVLVGGLIDKGFNASLLVDGSIFPAPLYVTESSLSSSGPDSDL